MRLAALRGHLHLLRQRANLQRHIDASLLPYLEYDSGPHILAESFVLRGQRILARRQLRENEFRILPDCDGVGFVRAGIHERKLRGWNDGSTLVFTRPTSVARTACAQPTTPVARIIALRAMRRKKSASSLSPPKQTAWFGLVYCKESRRDRGY